jgi:hypothetical protein
MTNIGWQDAVTRFAGERTRAETCAAVLKKHGDEAAIARGALTYAEAKSEIDAVIGGLITVLAQDKKPASLPELEQRLNRGIELRETLCSDAMAVIPAKTRAEGTKGDWVGLGKIFKSLVDAMKILALRWADGDEMKRKTIQTQLEAAIWRDFSEIPPLT